MRRIDIAASHSFLVVGRHHGLLVVLVLKFVRALGCLLIEILSKTSTQGVGFCFSSVPVYRQFCTLMSWTIPSLISERRHVGRLFAFTVLSPLPLVASLSPFACHASHAISARGCGYVSVVTSRCSRDLTPVYQLVEISATSKR